MASSNLSAAFPQPKTFAEMVTAIRNTLQPVLPFRIDSQKRILTPDTTRLLRLTAEQEALLRFLYSKSAAVIFLDGIQNNEVTERDAYLYVAIKKVFALQTGELELKQHFHQAMYHDYDGK